MGDITTALWPASRSNQGQARNYSHRSRILYLTTPASRAKHAPGTRTRLIRRMQRVNDRELDKDDCGGGPNLQTIITTSTATATPTTRHPLPNRHREDDAGENMPPYRSKVRVLDRYQIIGFISSGTYGRVYKARSKLPGNTKEFAIKK